MVADAPHRRHPSIPEPVRRARVTACPSCGTHDCPLRWADLDLLGHVSNVRYVDYLQERAAPCSGPVWRRRGRAARGRRYVVVRHEVTFLAPLLFRSTSVAIRLLGHRIRGASFTLGHGSPRDRGRRDWVVYLRACILAPSCTPPVSRAG